MNSQNMNSEGTIKEILKNEQSLLVALKNNDIASLDLLIHESLLFNIPGGETVTKEMDLAAYRTGNMSVAHLFYGEPIINIVGDTAIVAVTGDLKGKYLGQQIDVRLRYLRVWKLFGTEWKIIAGSSMPVNG